MSCLFTYFIYIIIIIDTEYCKETVMMQKEEESNKYKYNT